MQDVDIILINGRLKNGMVFENSEAMIYRGKTASQVPKSYKELGTVWHNMCSLYNTSRMKIFIASDKTYRYEIYRDGCFYPFYGRIEFLNYSGKDGVVQWPVGI